MIHEEIAEWFKLGWGWYIPLLDTIRREYETRHQHKDKIFIFALIKIARAGKRDGVLALLNNFTGLKS